MKRNDIAVLILIVGFSLIVAYFAGQAVLGGSKPKEVPVEVVDEIKPEVKDPDATVFNKDAINPAVSIKIGDSTNQQPFGQ